LATSPVSESSRKISICSVCAFAPWNSGRPAFFASFACGRFHVADFATVYSDGLNVKRSSLTLTSPSAFRSALGVGAPAPAISHPLSAGEPVVGDLEDLRGDLARRDVEGGAGPPGRERPDEVPLHDLLARRIEHADPGRGADVPIDHLADPRGDGARGRADRP